MPTYIALLQGVNVGPRKRIKMQDLRDLVTALGFTNVRTLVNSGNVVFESDTAHTNAELAATLERVISDHVGLPVPVVVRSGEEMAEVVAKNPFPDVAATPKLLHVNFFAEAPTAEWIAEIETFYVRGEDDHRVIGSEHYLYCPHGLSKSTFFVKSPPKRLHILATMRNWNTVTKLAEIAAE